MDKQFTKIAVTGSSGFVASNIIKKLNSEGYYNIDVYDKLDTLSEKIHNILGLDIKGIYDYRKLLENSTVSNYQWLIHTGANSATTTPPENYEKVLDQNFYYTKRLLELWSYYTVTNCAQDKNKFIFASSASVYGNSDDFTERAIGLRPPHLYGKTKLMCDLALEEYYNSYKAFSFRFFNAFGSDETHKIGRKMASPITRFLTEEPPFVLYRDENNTVFERDFIWVENIADVIYYTLTNECKSGLYNLGSGVGTTWEELVNICAEVRGLPKENLIKNEPLPEHLKRQYQAKTIANVDKLRNVLN